MAIYNEISAITAEVVTLAEAKSQLRIDAIVVHEDALITSYISEARELAEAYVGRFICERTVVLLSDGKIEDVGKQFSPIQSVVEISYKVAGADVVLDPSKYKLRSVDEMKKIVVFEDDLFEDMDEADDAFKITLKVGYAVLNVPAKLKTGIKLILSWLYENREDRPQEKRNASINFLRSFKKWD